MSKVRWLADYWQSGSLLAEVCHLCEGVRSSIGHLVISCCMCLSEYCECVSLGSDSIDCVGHNLLRRVPMYTSLGGKPAPRVRFDYTEKGDSTPRTGTVKFRSINSTQIPAELFLIDSRKSVGALATSTKGIVTGERGGHLYWAYQSSRNLFPGSLVKN
jgi:hypothetical protein